LRVEPETIALLDGREASPVGGKFRIMALAKECPNWYLSIELWVAASMLVLIARQQIFTALTIPAISNVVIKYRCRLAWRLLLDDTRTQDSWKTNTKRRRRKIAITRARGKSPGRYNGAQGVRKWPSHFTSILWVSGAKIRESGRFSEYLSLPYDRTRRNDVELQYWSWIERGAKISHNQGKHVVLSGLVLSNREHIFWRGQVTPAAFLELKRSTEDRWLKSMAKGSECAG